jgi:fatty-acyl-CoA synthase
MLHLSQLVKAGLFTPLSLWKLFRAKQKHGRNLCFLLKFAADRYGDKIAITDGHQQYSFSELYRLVLQLSGVIGTTVKPVREATGILLFDNSPDHVLSFYALQNLGVKLLLVNSRVHPLELSKIIEKQPGPCYLFTTDSKFLSNQHFNIHELVSSAKTSNGNEQFSREPARLVFSTSGTTGEPKMIEKRSGEFYWLRSFNDLLKKTGIHKRKSVYISIPVSHGFGYTAMLFALILGKKTLLLTGIEEKEIVSIVTKEQVDLLVGVPAALYRLAFIFQSTEHPVPTVISGGASFNDSTFKLVTEVFGRNVFSIYGSTEASVSFVAGFNHLNQHSNALGVPFIGVEYSLSSLPGGGEELLLRSRLANVSAGSGWLHTGDMVQKLRDGSLIWCGRKDDMIIRNGINIYPSEIEMHLLKDPAIDDVMVTGEKDDARGEKIVAFVKMKTGQCLDADAIKQRLKQFLAGAKIPDELIETPGFEYTATGKKLKPGQRTGGD